ncbi:MAG: penicillin-binding protein activator, partial [Gammaproteobacteria bacterium]
MFGPTVLVLCALALVGCTGSSKTAPVDDAGGAPASPQYQRARALLAQGSYAQAAAALVNLAAAAQGSERTRLELEAAEAFIAAGDLNSARAIVAAQPTLAPGIALSDRRSLVMAELALEERRAGDALAMMPRDLAPDTDLRTRLGLAHVRARAHEALGNSMEAARAHAELDEGLSDPNAMNDLPVRLNARMHEVGAETLAAENRAALWAQLRATPIAEFEAARGAPPDYTAGWIELAENTAPILTDPPALTASVSFWRQRYPGHPANLEIVPAMLDAAARAGTPPSHIALLLPLDGPFKEAGSAVKDGFVTAWNGASGAKRPKLDVLDTSTNAIVPLYRSAVESGADFVVGPLRKRTVSTLVESGAVSVPTLVLNEGAAGTHAPGAPAPEVQTSDPLTTEARLAGSGEAGTDSTQSVNDAAAVVAGMTSARVPERMGAPVFTFTLAPDAESRRVAEFAMDEGYRGAAVLAPLGAWGDRMTSAFRERWEEVGGTLVAEQRYDAEGEDLATPVKSLLQVESS